jgi:uncharacterized membrane protein YdjX (TVP38/TMEM64 family)
MTNKRKQNLKRYLPVALFAILLIILYLSGAHRYLNMHTIRAEHIKLQHFVSLHPLLSSIIFLVAYIVSVYLVIPDSIILSILGGFLFPLPVSFLYIASAETLGALLFFLTVKNFFPETMRTTKKSFFFKVKKEFHDHSVSYLLFLRFSHVFPFWLVNILAACFHIPTWRFIWTTCIGVLPFAYIFATGGRELSRFLQTPGAHLSHLFFNTEVQLSLIGMALLALTPVAFTKWKKWRKSRLK